MSEQVVLRAGSASATVEAGTFARCWLGAFWATNPTHPGWAGEITAADVRALSAAARRLGFRDDAARLDQLRAGMTGTVIVLREDGQAWSPALVSRQLGETPGEFGRAGEGDLARADIAAYFAVEQGGEA